MPGPQVAWQPHRRACHMCAHVPDQSQVDLNVENMASRGILAHRILTSTATRCGPSWMPSAKSCRGRPRFMALLLLCFGVVTAPLSLENPSAAFSRTYQSDREEICEAGNILCGGVSSAPGTRPFVCSQREAETDKGQGLGEGLRHLGALVVLRQDTCPQLPEQNSHRR